ncbi:hypothetical protein [Pseudoalteromonas rubra]|nr:hypothetical protein [Pseudoalteromonas rubra]
MMIKVLVVLLLLTSGNAMAFKWGAKTKITGYYVYADGEAFINVETKENPDNCADGSYLVLDNKSPNFNVLYSTVLTAYASQQTVTLNYSGCLGRHPKIISVAVPGVW